MMPQMESNQPTYEQPGTTYGAYEGNRESPHQQYETPSQQPPGEELSTIILWRLCLSVFRS